jgi:hypothetical protein
VLLPLGLGVELEHHGQRLDYRGSTTSWSGEYELTEARYRCTTCELTVTLSVREHVGSPVG